MPSFPSLVASFREKTNLPGVSYVEPDKATIYAEDVTQIEAEIVAVETVLGTNPEATAATVSERIANTESALDTNKAYTDDQITSLQNQITALENRHEYAVGDIFLSFNSTDPATAKGYGTWALVSQGRTLVGVDTSQTEFDTVREKGGEKTHTLTVTEMPSHNHSCSTYNGTDDVVIWKYPNGDRVLNGGNMVSGGVSFDHTHTIGSTGGSAAHNNLAPYLTCYIWERTA